MTNTPIILQIDITAKDRQGLVHEVSDVLFGAGANLADTSFVVLGAGCRLTLLAEFNHMINKEELVAALEACRAAKQADIRIMDFAFDPSRTADSIVTHRLIISGGDRPGLVQRISEVIVQHGANIVRLNSHRERQDSEVIYTTRYALHVPEDAVQALDNALTNTAGSLRLEAEFFPA